MSHSRHVHMFAVLLWMKNVLVDISGTKRNGKFSNGKNLDIVIERC